MLFSCIFNNVDNAKYDGLLSSLDVIRNLFLYILCIDGWNKRQKNTQNIKIGQLQLNELSAKKCARKEASSGLDLSFVSPVFSCSENSCCDKTLEFVI